MAGDPCRARHAGGRAHRLGQDAHGLPRGARRPGAPRPRSRRPARRDRRRLRLAAEGAVQRHPPEPRRAARGHPRRAGGAGPARDRHPHRRAHRRHAAARAPAEPAPAAARAGDHARVALRAAGLRLGPQDAVDGAQRDRRRDPRHRREQARQPPGAVAGAIAGALHGARRRAAGAHRPVGHAEAHRRGGALPGRRGRAARRRHGRLRDRRHRLCQAARPRARAAAHAARGRDVGRPVDAGLCARGRARVAAQDHAGVRQHAPHGRARSAAPGRHPRQGGGGRAPWQSVEGDAAGRRAAPQARRAQGARRHGLARAGPGHRRRRPRVPARLAARHRHLSAARRALGPCGGRRAEGAAVRAVARRAGRMRRPARLHPPRRARRAARAAGAAGRAGAADRGRDRLPRMERGPAVRPGTSRLALCAAVAGALHGGGAHGVRGLRHAAGPARGLCAPRCRAPPAARTQGRAHDRADLRRHHPRDRRLHGRAGTAGRQDRHRQRGLRGREPRGRRVPARQHQLPHPQDRAGPRAGGGRAGRGAQHPVLAR